LPVDPETATFLLAAGVGGDAFFDAAVTGAAVRVVIAVFLAAVLAGCFALTADDAGGFAVFAAPARVAPGAFVFAGVLPDSTALFAADFRAAGMAVDFLAGARVASSSLTVFFAKVLLGVTATACTDLPRAGFVREAVVLGVFFFVLLADFATVAFMVPCPLTNLPTPRSCHPPRAIHDASHRRGPLPLKFKPA